MQLRRKTKEATAESLARAKIMKEMKEQRKAARAEKLAKKQVQNLPSKCLSPVQMPDDSIKNDKVESNESRQPSNSKSDEESQPIPGPKATDSSFAGGDETMPESTVQLQSNPSENCSEQTTSPEAEVAKSLREPDCFSFASEESVLSIDIKSILDRIKPTTPVSALKKKISRRRLTKSMEIVEVDTFNASIPDETRLSSDESANSTGLSSFEGSDDVMEN